MFYLKVYLPYFTKPINLSAKMKEQQNELEAYSSPTDLIFLSNVIQSKRIF